MWTKRGKARRGKVLFKYRLGESHQRIQLKIDVSSSDDPFLPLNLHPSSNWLEGKRRKLSLGIPHSRGESLVSWWVWRKHYHQLHDPWIERTSNRKVMATVLELFSSAASGPHLPFLHEWPTRKTSSYRSNCTSVARYDWFFPFIRSWK